MSFFQFIQTYLILPHKKNKIFQVYSAFPKAPEARSSIRGDSENCGLSVPVFSGCHLMLTETGITNTLPTEIAKGCSELLSGVPI